jgi:molecular chaperone DnaK
MTKLIPANTTIPTRKSRIFSTAADNQPTATVHVLQGEREMAADNRTLGRFDLMGIPPAPRGVPQIEVTFDIDANGITHVSAKDLGTGKAQEIAIKQHGGVTQAEMDRMIGEAQEHAGEDRAKKEFSRVLNDAETLLYSTDRALKEFSNRLSPRDAEAIQTAVGRVTAAKDGRPEGIGELKEAVGHLQALMHKLAETIYSVPRATGQDE